MSYDSDYEPEELEFEELVSATNNFSDEYLIAETSFAKFYKVPYSQLKKVVDSEEDDTEEDWFDVVIQRSMTGRPNLGPVINELMLGCGHRNVVHILGYLVDDDEKHEAIVVTKYEVNGSLDKHLSDPTTLTWIRRLRICLGVARAMSFMHYGDDEVRVIHGNIKSSRILLDDKWEPKLFGFQYSIFCHPNQQLSLTNKYRGTIQYMDPAYEKSGGLSYKSDVFSFGVVLFEVLFGTKASIVNDDKWYFARLARLHYEEKRLDDMIDPVLRQQMDTQSLEIFAKTAYYCLNEQRAQRLNTHEVVKRLKEALDHQMEYENPELATIEDESTVFIHPKGKNLEHLKIRLSDILSATKNFSETYFLGSGGFAKVYRAELDHFDSSQSWSVAEKDKGEFPKRRSMVAIKRILGIKGKQGFFAEIEMLTSCKHENIVSLLGFCDEDSHMILVYEYVSNRSLDDHLENSSKMTNFTWARRIRICLNIANGLKYLHSSTEDKQMIVHRDIKSANILLNNNFEAKIADFGLSKLRPVSQKGSTLNTNLIAGTYVYLDPEYKKTGKLKKESDIYSFGVVMFEIMCGKVAYDTTYLDQNEKGLAFVARRYWSEGRIKEMLDPNIQEAYENIFMINKGLSQDSLDTFSRIAYQCVAETQAERPTIEVIINELEKALSFEENHKDNLEISVEEIILATQNFSPENCVGSGRYWKAYEGELLHANGRHTSIVAKRWEGQSDHQFLTELDVLIKCKHENIIGLSGYCKEKVIVYEHSKGSLDKYLNDASLTWTKRLKICIDVARGLHSLHDDTESMSMIHRGIKSANIQLDGDWKAKISNFHLSSSLTFPFKEEIEDIENVSNDANDSLGYLDPNNKNGFLTDKTDIYSLGVVLFEILCGRLAWVEGCEDHSQSLGPLAKCLYEEDTLDEIVFEGIKDQIVPKSFTTFEMVAYECLDDDSDDRPSALDVMEQLEKALELQEDYEIWAAKLPKDYKEIFGMSKSPEMHSTKSNKDLYDMLNKGILLQQDKVLFSLGSSGERNEMISARKFSYKKRWLHRWRSVPESRFPKVAEVLDVRNLMIEIKLKTPLLSLGVNYKVNLIFRFCGPRKSYAKRMYVNLKYKKGGENFHAYFATWRDDGWMIIELCPFFYNKEDTDFEVLLESFSRCYSGSRTIYVEGIEFQAIDNVISDEVGKVEEVQANDNVMKQGDIENIEVQSIDNVKQVEIGKLMKFQQFLKSDSKRDKLKYMLSKMNRKKHDMLSDVKDHIIRKVNEKKDHLVSKVSTKKDRLLSRVNRKKDRFVSRVNRVKDHLVSAKDVLYGYFDEELNLTPSAQSRFETGNDEMLKISDNHDECEELLSVSNVNRNEHHMLSAKDFLYGTSKVTLLQLKPSVQSRFQEVVELRSQQVLHIKYKIKFQMSPNTEYACYLVFKLSERCRGLHCPVIVRDLLQWKKDTGILYFRSPNPWNLYDTHWVPKKREDGWMEVNVWKFHSDFELRNGSIPVNLKLVTYEGTMSGLIVCGLEIRPI